MASLNASVRSAGSVRRCSSSSGSRSSTNLLLQHRPARSSHRLAITRAVSSGQQQQQQPMPAQQQRLRCRAATAADHHDAAAASSSSTTSTTMTLAMAVALLALTSLSSSDPAAAASTGSDLHQHSIQPMLDLAEGEEFWGNVAKYGRYFVTVMLGTGYVMVQPVMAAFKRPVTAVAAIVGIGGGFVLLRFVLNAMLGVQEPFEYEPGSIVPYDF